MENNYKSLLTKYGLLTMLYLLEHYERCENFEECQKLCEAIKDYDLPTIIDSDTIKIVKAAYEQLGLTGENMIHNSKIYAEEILCGKK